MVLIASRKGMLATKLKKGKSASAHPRNSRLFGRTAIVFPESAVWFCDVIMDGELGRSLAPCQECLISAAQSPVAFGAIYSNMNLQVGLRVRFVLGRVDLVLCSRSRSHGNSGKTITFHLFRISG
jgi:hypothetical protein